MITKLLPKTVNLVDWMSIQIDILTMLHKVRNTGVEGSVFAEKTSTLVLRSLLRGVILTDTPAIKEKGPQSGLLPVSTS